MSMQMDNYLPPCLTSGTPRGAVLWSLYFTMFSTSIRESIKEYIEEEAKEGKEMRTREEECFWSLCFMDDTKARG